MDSGRKVSLYYYCKGLHETQGYDIYLYSFLEPGQSEKMIESKPDFIKEVRLAKPISKFSKLKSLCIRSLFWRWPFQCSIYFSKQNKESIHSYCEDIQPDCIFVDMIRLAPYFQALKNIKCRKYLDLDDLLSRRYERQLLNKHDKGPLMGAFSTGEDKRFNGRLKKIVLKLESRRIKRAEIKYGEKYDRVIFVSDKETEIYNAILPEKAITIRLGVDYDYYSAPINANVKEQGVLTFLGNLKFAPNVASLDLLVNEILPKLNFSYTLKVVGVYPKEIKERYKNERIVFLGRVNDVRSIIKNSEIFLAPIAYGSGVKTKILETMAMGVPIITNSLGIEGIDVLNNEHLIVADDFTDFAEKVNLLHEDRMFAQNLGQNAQLLVKNMYDWREVYKSFKSLDA